MATIVIEVQNDNGEISLWDVYNEGKKEFYHEPCLEFRDFEYEDLWDNDEYVLNFLSGLKKKKKEQVKELKELCKEHKVEFEYYRKSLIDIYKSAKKLGLWKKEN